MKIGIIGTRGVPNEYGGFEQFATGFAIYAVQQGHEVSVYCSTLHPNKSSEYCGVKRIICFDPEDKMGTPGQFIYDLNCILDSRKRKYDVILQLGYTSSSIWNFLFRKGDAVVTNMDGMEWMRSKYNSATKRFLKYAEKLAVNHSNQLIADSPAIADYYIKQYQKSPIYIAYGAEVFTAPNKEVIQHYKLEPNQYDIVVARMEPENNLEMIANGYVLSKGTRPLVIVGNTNTKYGAYLKAKFKSANILFTEGIYNQSILNNLRYFAHCYFHGHSVGGTNPSLIEAMGCNVPIAAHQNIYNKHVLGNSAYYFSNEDDVAKIMKGDLLKKEVNVQDNLSKLKEEFSPNAIYSKTLNTLLQNAH